MQRAIKTLYIKRNIKTQMRNYGLSTKAYCMEIDNEIPTLNEREQFCCCS